MYMLRCIAVCLCLAAAHAIPPDKVSGVRSPMHIIKTRSIDINDAHVLSLETKLPDVLKPTEYRLQLRPNFEKNIYEGIVKINITWMDNTSAIVIHCDPEVNITYGVLDFATTPYEVLVDYVKVGTRNITLTRSTTKSENRYYAEITANSFIMDEKSQSVYVFLNRNILKDSVGTVEIKFNGKLQTDSTEAFFKSTYETDQNVERLVAGFQLRPTNARRVFPCFDEPGEKVPFRLSMVLPRGMTALSNRAIEYTEEVPGSPDLEKIHFEWTPPMSTFALGFVMGDLQQLGEVIYFTDDNNNSLELRVWGRPEFHTALGSVKDNLVLVLKEVANFWRVPLPLDRLDIVALPNYQAVKPTDSWGLIVFRESDLAYRGVLVLATELCYQWLGVYVTPEWWSVAHINKALVGYVAADIAARLNNESERDGNWPITVLYSLYYEYSKRYPHSRITGMKQETACTKLELVFRMLNYTLGESVFKTGMKNFLNSRKFKTFTGNDIWTSLNESFMVTFSKNLSTIDVETVATSWITHDRLPMVNAIRQYDSNTVILTQKVYLRDRPHNAPDVGRMTWWIPLVVLRSDQLDFQNTKPEAWMRNEKQVTLERMPDRGKFIIVNPEEIAPFPVNYDIENWKLLSTFLQSKDRTKIPPFTRAKLLHDAWNLAYAGELAADVAFNMTLFLKEERHHLVWEPVFTMIDHFGRHICPCMQPKFQAYVRVLLGPLYEELKRNQTEDEAQWQTRFRSMAKSFLCQAGYKSCVKEAQDHYRQWMQVKHPDEGNPVPDMYMCPVFMHGTMKEWEFGLQRVINFPSSRKRRERTYLLKSLAGCPTDPAKIKRLLNITMIGDKSNFTDTDMFLIFGMLTGSSHGYTVLFDFLSNNWKVLKEKYQSNTNIWDDLIHTATSKYTTQEGLDLVKSFYRNHTGEFGSATHIIGKSIRNIEEEVKWSSENLPVLDKWLDEYLSNSKVDDPFIKH